MNRLLLPAPATKQEPPTEGTAPELDTRPPAAPFKMGGLGGQVSVPAA